MDEKDSRIVLTDPAPVESSRFDAQLSPAERAWLVNQQRKQLGHRSKYVPHQGVQERAKRLARMAAQGKKG